MKKIKVVMLICLMVTGCKETAKVSPPIGSKSIYNTVEIFTPIQVNRETEIKIIPIEHATAILQWNGLNIFIDPVGGAAAFSAYGRPDLILITDIHGDHFSLETLLGLDTSRAKIMVPQTVADKIPDEFTPQLDVLNNGDSKERYGINVEAIPMYNLRKEALKFHEKGRGNGYVLHIGGERLYFSGDTEDIPEMRALENIDKAFICMNLPYTMTVESAASAVLEFRPKQVYPYHYRGNPNVSDVSKFKKLVRKENPNIEVIQLDWYPKETY
ncbi:MBL fold metallo-hydrolase [Maribacter sp. 2304DJ31-5]|uniref:MBL fold metallo-hydrolase n=1 Tax=Maribacter sp. 2304DJ31-5 TaxID=3386273 RepID=UPI0039BD40CF